MADIANRLTRMSEAPAEKEAFGTWLEMGSALQFLRDSTQLADFVVYASDRYSFIHSVLVPAASVSPPDVDDLMDWNFNPVTSCGISYTYSEPRSVATEPPLRHTGSKTIDGGEQLVFAAPGGAGYQQVTIGGIGQIGESELAL